MFKLTAKNYLINEIETLPTEYLEDVLNFIGYLKTKKQHSINSIPETMLLSEKTLAKDWLCVEEDEAWKNL